MKGIIKLFPIALGLLTLASCSNDDFFGSENETNRLQLTATVEAPDFNDDLTRAAFVPTTMAALWQDGDQFRVYDAALQKYDEFVCNGSAIVVDGTPVVDTHSKAIFPGNQVYYAGYDKANDDVIAIMEVPATITYGGQAKTADGSVAYVSALPMWGDVTDATSSNLKVDLKNLGAYTDITVYQKSVTNIRILAAATGVVNTTTVTGTTTLANATTAQILANAATILDVTTPLAGYFEAQLKTDGVLKANTTNPVLAGSYSSVIDVDLAANAADEAHVYVPIIPGVEYANLIIQTSADNGASWTILKAYPADSKFNRNGVLRKGLVCGNAPITAHVSSLYDLNRKLNIIATTTDYKDKIVNIYFDGDVKTGEDQGDPDATNANYDVLSDGTAILIPALSNDLHVNFIAGEKSGVFTNKYTNNALVIKNRTSATNTGKTATINFKGGLDGTENVVIDTDAKVVLAGTFKSSTNGDGYDHQTIELKDAGALTLGLGIDGDFATDNMVIKLSKTGVAVNVDANEGTVNLIYADDATYNNTITVISGKVTTIGGTVATVNKNAATPVTVSGGEVGTVNTKAADVTVNGGKVTKIVTNGTGAGAGDVSITAGTVAEVSSAKGAVTVAADATATKITTTTGAVTVNADAIVEDVTTGEAAATISAPINSLTSGASTSAIAVNANIETLKLSAATTGMVTITGTTNADDEVVKIGAIQGTYNVSGATTQTINLTSTDKAAVGEVTFAKAGGKVTATSSVTATIDLDDVKTTEIGSSKIIYTAAQLAGMGTGSYKLDTDVTALGTGWTPLNLSGDFKLVQAHSITGLNAPLFNKVTGSSTIGDQKLTIAGFTYTGDTDENNLGVIAKEVDGATVTIKNVALTGTSNTLTGDATSENVGAVIGKAKVSSKLTLDGVQFAALTLTGHANVGGFIGNVAGGTVEIKKASAASTITLAAPAGTYDATDDDLAGTFGNIIGSITENATITIGVSSDNLAKFLTAQVTNTNHQSTYKYNSNVDAEGGKFSGMYGTSLYTKQPMSYEIGYSPASAIAVTMYGVTKDALDNPVTITEEDINQFND